jgi:hypothetical protein
MSYVTCRRMVCVCALAAISNSLYAVDGIILIDQNRALAGNVTPGDAPGFPVSISQSGSYRLSGNITVPDVNTTAIQITADFVTLDLNGFSIVGPNVCTPNPTTCSARGSGTGVLADDKTTGKGPLGVRVLNGAVRGMGLDGISLKGQVSAVERVISHSNGDFGINVLTGSVIDSVASVNNGTGIRAPKVSGSTAEQNGNIGILAFELATGNVAVLNGGSGILIGSCPSSIVGNTTVGNRGGGIVAGGSGCTLANNAP